MFKKLSRNILFALVVAVILIIIYREYNIKEGFSGGIPGWAIALIVISVAWTIVVVAAGVATYPSSSNKKYNTAKNLN
jgi:hypothetical protein|uniref:Uncharacterized protein n=1 Tax=viral metagenome TaxID=1070528 RepID=A0A6C0DD14_9ZZZZ